MEKIEIIKCPNCGSNKVHREEELYVCDVCHTHYRDDGQYYEFKDIVESQLENFDKRLEAKLLSHEETEKGNLRQLLLREVEKDNFSNNQVINLCEDLLKLDPNDIVANYFYKFCKRKKYSGQSEYIGFIKSLGDVDIDAYDEQSIVTFMVSHVDIDTKETIFKLLQNRGILSKYNGLLNKSYKNYETKDDLWSNIKRKVFICHKSQDKEKVYEILIALEKEYGFNKCWISERNIPHTEDTIDYYKNIDDAIDNCEYFLVVTSEKSMHSDDVKREIKYAAEHNKQRIEYILDESSKGEGRTVFFKQYFAGLEWIDGSQGPQYQKIINKIVKWDLNASSESDDFNGQQQDIKGFIIEKRKLKKYVGKANNVIIPNNVTIIEDSVSFNCESLTIPNSVKSIETTLSQCKKVIYNGTISQWSSIDFKNSSSNPLSMKKLYINGKLFQEENIVLEGIDKIGQYAFANCDFIESIIIPSSVKNIGESAFIKCASLKKLTLPYIDTYLGYYFGGTSYKDNYNYVPKSLTSLTITNGKKIPRYAFYEIRNLDNITIYSEVVNIGRYSFASCDYLRVVKIEEANKLKIENRAFYNCDENKVTFKPESINLKINKKKAFGTNRVFNTITIMLLMLFLGIIATIITSPIIPFFYKLWNNLLLTGLSSVNFIPQDKKAINVIYLSFILFWLIFALALGCLTIAKLKQKKKRYPLLLFFVSLIITTTGAVAYINPNSPISKKIVHDQYVMQLNENGEEYEVASIDLNLFGGEVEVKIPSEYQGKPVTSIDSSFKISDIFSNHVVNITFEENSNLTRIEEGAFANCDKLKSITIPSSVESIGKDAFSNCSALTRVDYEKTLAEWVNIKFEGNNANPLENSKAKLYLNGTVFDESNLVLENIDKIGSYAFAGCDFIKSIQIKKGVNSIENNAFYNCKSLGVAIISEGVQSIGNGIFEGCVSLNNLTLPYLNTFLGSYFGAVSYNLNSQYVPETLKEVEITGESKIPDNAFYGCKSLTDINILNENTSVGKNAFEGCMSLENLIMPSLDNFLGYYFGAYNVDIANAHIPSSLKNLKILSGTVIKPKSFYNSSFIDNIVIASGVTSIEEDTFSNCSSLTSVTIPSSVTSIGKNAFSNCTSLQKVNYEGTISEWASIDFGNKNANPLLMKKLYINGKQFQEENIVLKEINKIGSYAFDGCDFIKTITIPSSVTSVGDEAFSNCSSLERVNYEGTISNWANIAFNNSSASPLSNNRAKLYINEKQFQEKNIVLDEIDKIGSAAFYNCDFIKTITIPSSIKSVGENAFFGCNSLTIYCAAYSKPNGWVDSWNSSNCQVYWGVSDDIKKGIIFVLDNDQVTITNYVGTSNSVIIPSIVKLNNKTYQVTKIGKNAFSNCNFLTSITIPSSVTSIGESAFKDCNSLESLTLPFIDTYLGYYFGASIYSDNATYVPKSLKSVSILGGTSIPQNVFFGCNTLESLTLPFMNTFLGYYFGASENSDNETYVPKSLKTVTILGGTSIVKDAFFGCDALENLTLPFIDKFLGYYFGAGAFYTTPDHISESLKSVVILGGTSIPSDAFYECSYLTNITIPSSVTSIGYGAFEGCSSLERVNYKGTVSKWANIDFILRAPNGMFSYYSNPLSNGKAKLYINNILQENIVLEGINKIGSCAFFNCNFIKTVTIPINVTSIGEYAFSNCDSLIIYCEASSKLDGWSDNWNSDTGFIYLYTSYCPVIWNYNAEKLVELEDFTYYLNDDEVTLIKYRGSSSSVIIENNIQVKGQTYEVTSIGSRAFYDCSSLTSITIPTSVKNIGIDAFYKCNSIKRVNYEGTISQWATIDFEVEEKGLPLSYSSNPLYNDNAKLYINDELQENIVLEGIEKIGTNAFSNCDFIKTITIDDGITSIGNNAFYGCSSLERVNYEGTISQWASIDFANSYANPLSNGKAKLYIDGELFQEENIVLEGIDKIGSFAFYNCDFIKTITIPRSVTNIGWYAFSNCTQLQNVTFDLNSELESIGLYAFSNCSSLESITIPDSVTSIGDAAFYGCSSLERVNYEGTISQWASIDFANSYANPLSNGKAKLYIDGELFQEENIVLEGIDKIGSFAFYNCDFIKTITIPSSVKSIGSYAFSNCTQLQNVTFDLNSELESIGLYAFSNCSSLESITIPDSVTSIGSYAFYQCWSLKSITIPSNVTSIGEYAITGCDSLIIYCEALITPSGWDFYWNYSSSSVYWGYQWHYENGVPTLNS